MKRKLNLKESRWRWRKLTMGLFALDVPTVIKSKCARNMPVKRVGVRDVQCGWKLRDDKGSRDSIRKSEVKKIWVVFVRRFASRPQG